MGIDGGRAVVEGLTTLLEVFLDETLFVVFVDDGLPVLEERCHDEDVVTGEVGEVELE